MEYPQVHEDGSAAAGRSEFRGRGVRGVTAAAVLLAAGALNMTAEGSAEAASGGTWDRLAGCESGGNWHADTGNGFSGGLQFAHTTWRSFGGGTFASRAALASRLQQINVAERVLARQGWGAWPACSASLGLRGSVSGRTTAPRTTTPRASAPHRTTPRTTTPKAAPAPGKRWKAPRHRSAGGSVVVNLGDTVSGIASAHGWRWQEFYRLNRAVIGADPDLIFPGMRLAVRRSGTS
ncbi:transglycosylase family protein [Streptomyces chattanoogensis]|uniref:Peptidoglycan-binding protein n=1 Tax=Streptomyces chattanoogensis TaxID=66876 RepID=A0A0N0GVY1_9ACTN|nr:transglycosylase family protein [Streptomyces chattanoogensis]KPC59679.1 peptidoglycan-binding protein [Streptomyces chattanoogensis]